MQYRKTWLILLMIAMAALWGCSDDDDDDNGGPTDPGMTAFEAMAEAGKAYINDSADSPGVLGAVDLNDNLADYTVIDIRREEDYLAGHIPGAYHSSFGTILDDLSDGTIPTDKPYVVACYTGQSAGHIKIAMELMGYEDTYSLKFGMSSWNSSLDRWTPNTANLLGNPETTNNNDQLTEHAFPELSEDPATVVSDRVQWMLAEGFKIRSYPDIMDNLGDYFVLNYHALEDYLGQGSSGVPGHIPGAFQFTPYQSLGDDQMLNMLPTDMPIVVYCWTGQHSSQVTAYLNMLGYDAYSLAFGSNALFYDQLTAHKWTSAATNDFALEVGTPPNQAFQTVADAMLDYVNDSGDCPGVISAVDLNDNLAAYTVIDIRAENDYNAGHIPDAYHSSLGTVLDDLSDGTIPTDKPFVVACYTGQSAGHVKIAMELMGYEDTYSLKFGMSSWNTSLDRWTPNTSNLLGNPETTDNNGDLMFQDYPSLPQGATVESLVDDMLAGGFQAIAYSDIMDNLSEYFVLNYHAREDYIGEGSSGVPGHIPGAYQFTPYQSLSYEQMLGMIPTDMPVVVYCWTGQHSSQIAAYLNMLGYEAYSLKFGSNALFYDQLTAHKWTAAGQSNDFTLETTTVAVK